MKEKKKFHSLREKMIAINLSATVLSLIICGAVFVGSVYLILGNYIQRDLDFFLTETSNNLMSKTEFLENVIYQIRDSEKLMEYLKDGGVRQPSQKKQEELNAVYGKVVNISSQKNLGNGNEPIVEKVYLFDKKEHFLSTAYYSMLYSESEENKKDVNKIYLDFKERENKGTQDFCYYRGKNSRAYLAYTLFDENMEARGVVVFEIRLDVLIETVNQIHDYKNAFWLIYDTSGKVLCEEGWGRMGEAVDRVGRSYCTVPYEAKIGSSQYRIFTQSLNMGLSATIGIPQGQVQNLLYDSLSIYLAIGFASSILLFLGFAMVVYRLTKPLKELTEKLKLVREGDFETKLPDYDSEEFHEISMVFNEMTEYVNNLIKQVYEKQISVKEMELKFMQTQMNPHFMFNVLNTIALQAKMDGNEQTYKMITSFSSLIQAKIYRKDSEKVQIRQELEYVEYYLYLQGYRYGERLNYTIDIEDMEILDMYMPKLCLQLIVENAVVHGIEPKMEPGFVELRVFEEKGSIYIEVTDNGVGFDEDGEIFIPEYIPKADKGHNHVGLNNAQHILQLMYGEQYGIRIFSQREKGTRVVVHIPFDSNEIKNQKK